ncbi:MULTISPECIES: transposase [unclassified Streptomyces]|uniref:transposase n=1 Tax=unclassified Streptomyces TaxID=2593676 RepID=UPI00202ED47E|nr:MULTISPECIES: transposase [unclassified Streptomyces]MCM1974953.1 transposase [Streptomyces sp. G1]MCX5122549.1 transposase [Streptomyces sp. NBC_00347]MCX5295905.1 transposase [Streptomyces sp. NBC_00193]
MSSRQGASGSTSWSTRVWTCDRCGTRHDRDHNAAKNVKYEGRRIRAAWSGTTHPRTGGPCRVTGKVSACGAHVRPGFSPAARATPTDVGRKQEPSSR